MNEFSKTMAVSASGLQAQSARLRLASENIANADTPGFHRKTVSFKDVMNREIGTTTVATGPLRLDQSALQSVYSPGHPLADASGHYEGSNVDLVIEIADARETQRSYEANLRLFNQAREMANSLLELLRR